MGFFGFIENFFFISLGIVFGLVLLLVYHFKTRMAVAEKKSESMYGLLSAVVKEIKTLRGMFGLGGKGSEESPVDVTPLVQQYRAKTEPEIQVELIDKFVPEVITYDLSPASLDQYSAKKIIVSDDESDDELDEDSAKESDDESDDEDSAKESDDEDSVKESDDEDSAKESEDEDSVKESEDQDSVKESENEDSSVHLEDVLELVVEDFSANQEEPQPILETIMEKNEVVELSLDFEPESVTKDPEPDVKAKDNEQRGGVELRKMNINQLKTIAIQQGIKEDTGKLKKQELIALILSKNSQ